MFPSNSQTEIVLFDMWLNLKWWIGLQEHELMKSSSSCFISHYHIINISFSFFSPYHFSTLEKISKSVCANFFFSVPVQKLQTWLRDNISGIKHWNKWKLHLYFLWNVGINIGSIWGHKSFAGIFCLSWHFLALLWI